jgi:hypothetical protein
MASTGPLGNGTRNQISKSKNMIIGVKRLTGRILAQPNLPSQRMKIPMKNAEAI